MPPTGNGTMNKVHGFFFDWVGAHYTFAGFLIIALIIVVIILVIWVISLHRSKKEGWAGAMPTGSSVALTVGSRNSGLGGTMSDGPDLLSRIDSRSPGTIAEAIADPYTTHLTDFNRTPTMDKNGHLTTRGRVNTMVAGCTKVDPNAVSDALTMLQLGTEDTPFILPYAEKGGVSREAVMNYVPQPYDDDMLGQQMYKY